jgi:hypothetical protein
VNGVFYFVAFIGGLIGFALGLLVALFIHRFVDCGRGPCAPQS